MPAAGSRSSVCMYTPDRKSATRRFTLRGVVERSSGAPRSQFLTRRENSQEPMRNSVNTQARFMVVRNGTLDGRSGNHGAERPRKIRRQADVRLFVSLYGILRLRRRLHARMVRHGTLDVRLIGVARAGWSCEQLFDRVRDSLNEYGGRQVAPPMRVSSSRSRSATIATRLTS